MEWNCFGFCWPDLHGRSIYSSASPQNVCSYSPYDARIGRRVSLDALVRERRVEWGGRESHGKWRYTPPSFVRLGGWVLCLFSHAAYP